MKICKEWLLKGGCLIALLVASLSVFSSSCTQERPAKASHAFPQGLVPLLRSRLTCDEMSLALHKGMTREEVVELVASIPVAWGALRTSYFLSDGSLSVLYGHGKLEEWRIERSDPAESQ